MFTLARSRIGIEINFSRCPEYYFWKGAQVARPFKAYVRQSQVETLVWYSAYPKPATININTNTNVRQSLFKTLTSCEIDSLFQKL